MRRKNPASAQPAAAPAAVAPVAAAPAAADLPLTFSSPTAAIGARVKAVGREFAARGLLDAQPFGEADTLVHEHLRRCQGALIVAGKAEMSDASTAEGVKKAVLAAAQSEVELLNAAMKTRNEEWVEIVVPDSYVYFRTLEDRSTGREHAAVCGCPRRGATGRADVGGIRQARQRQLRAAGTDEGSRGVSVGGAPTCPWHVGRLWPSRWRGGQPYPVDRGCPHGSHLGTRLGIHLGIRLGAAR